MHPNVRTKPIVVAERGADGWWYGETSTGVKVKPSPSSERFRANVRAMQAEPLFPWDRRAAK